MKKIEAFDIALRVAGFNFSKQHVELICNLHSLVEQKEGKTTVDDITEIEIRNKEKYEDKK